jgi:hypothetical protein
MIMKKTTPERRYISEEPTDHDVLCGRGNVYAKHPGNVAFQQVILEHTTDYATATGRQFKVQIVDHVLHHVHDDLDARILKHDVETDQWYEVSRSHAHQKTGHCLRDTIRNTRSTPRRPKPKTTKKTTTPTKSPKTSKAAQAIQQHRQNERHNNASRRIPFLREELANVDATNGLPFLRDELQVLQKQPRPHLEALVMDVDEAMQSMDNFVTSSLANKTSEAFSSSHGYWYYDRQNQTDEEEEETETTVDCKDDCGLCEEDQETETKKDEPHDACDLCLHPDQCASATAVNKKHHRRKRTSVILFDNEFPELTMEFSPSAFFGQQ